MEGIVTKPNKYAEQELIDQIVEKRKLIETKKAQAEAERILTAHEPPPLPDEQSKELDKIIRSLSPNA